jgi:hypothetical protein
MNWWYPGRIVADKELALPGRLLLRLREAFIEIEGVTFCQPSMWNAAED